ncbi:chloride channel core [Streptomyces albus subsp. albus]|nr:chloride channel core [Streptomyces albus subsp. albus]
MTEPSPGPAAGGAPVRPAEPVQLRELVRSPDYLKGLAFCALLGIPVSLAAFWFLAAIHQVQHALWTELPHALDRHTPPWWWPLPLLLVAGVLVGLVIRYAPGAGGHVPAYGLHAGAPAPAALPGILVAAMAGLPLGAVLGPEAPLIALGGGLAVLCRDLVRAPATPQSTALLGAAGAAAAVAVIFGNPLIAAVLLIEVAGVGGPRLVAMMLPALLSSGVGSLVFTGFGRWTGLQIGSLTLRLPEPDRLDAGDMLWSVVIGVVVGVFVHGVFAVARRTAGYTAARPLTRTVGCALATGACLALYALSTGRSPAQAALSGQQALGELARHPHDWGVAALVALVLCKSAGYALCLGSLRGGPIFPALFLGAAVGVLLSPLPGLGTVPGMAAGMSATAAAALRLPVSSVVLVVLLLGGVELVPVVMVAAVVAIVATELLPAAEPA